MTDGSKYNIAVYNGLNGTGTGDVLGIHFDLVLPAAGWSNGSITVAESLPCGRCQVQIPH